jgi:predicted signal transduction protein with EAL and GGDEF domain
MQTAIARNSNLQRKAVYEIVLIASIGVASWFLSHYLNLAQRLYQATKMHSWVDEFIIVSIVVAVGMGVFAFRRWGELRREAAYNLELHVRLLHDAYHDSLTQLRNRPFFLDLLKQCVKRAKRHANYKFAVVFVDVDRLKAINDAYGHVTGDQLLVQISERLISSIRTDEIGQRTPPATRSMRPAGSDVLARLGGDEFAILLDDIRDPSDGARVAERVLQNLAVPFLINGAELQVTASIGIALSGAGHSAAGDVLRDAVTAMYRAKSSEGSRYEICDPTMHEVVVNRLKLEDGLRNAVQRDEFEVYYQPIVSLRDSRLTGFEALVRWQRPDFGLVPPGEFISIAEETGLIVPIGSWVMREACRQMSVWCFEFPCVAQMTMSVNVSARQFAQPDLVDKVDQVLRGASLAAQNLKIELTESVAMRDAQRAAAILGGLRALGVRTSVDDFGTGYSSLSYLQRLSLNTLKIDRSFVSQIESSHEGHEIVRAIANLAHGLGMDVVAEGVETPAQAERLRSLGCEYAQGYYFSKPLDRARAELLLRSSADLHVSPRLPVSGKVFSVPVRQLHPPTPLTARME